MQRVRRARAKSGGPGKQKMSRDSTDPSGNFYLVTAVNLHQGQEPEWGTHPQCKTIQLKC